MVLCIAEYHSALLSVSLWVHLRWQVEVVVSVLSGCIWDFGRFQDCSQNKPFQLS